MMLLREEHATLARVAESVGYGSEAALSVAFKRHTGCHPVSIDGLGSRAHKATGDCPGS